MLLTQDGSVWSSGLNANGQLGIGSTATTYGFAQVIPSEAKAVAAGTSHSIVLKQDGSVWATGLNSYGQLGNGFIIGSKAFVQVCSSGAKAVAAGG